MQNKTCKWCHKQQHNIYAKLHEDKECLDKGNIDSKVPMHLRTHDTTNTTCHDCRIMLYSMTYCQNCQRRVNHCMRCHRDIVLSQQAPKRQMLKASQKQLPQNSRMNQNQIRQNKRNRNRRPNEPNRSNQSNRSNGSNRLDKPILQNEPREKLRTEEKGEPKKDDYTRVISNSIPDLQYKWSGDFDTEDQFGNPIKLKKEPKKDDYLDDFTRAINNSILDLQKSGNISLDYDPIISNTKLNDSITRTF